jgi:hypothetical protein
MRTYLPIDREQLVVLHRDGALPGPLRGCAVDPAWRAGDPAADEEQWEYEAQSLAAESLPDGDGVVLAVDVEVDLAPAEGWVVVPGPIRRADVAAVLSAELAWFAAQEIPALLEGGEATR